jgi:hypothetical protein
VRNTPRNNRKLPAERASFSTKGLRVKDAQVVGSGHALRISATVHLRMKDAGSPPALVATVSRWILVQTINRLDF